MRRRCPDCRHEMARVVREGDPASLLRPASQDDTAPETLLRGPTGEVEEEGLLRRVEPTQ